MQVPLKHKSPGPTPGPAAKDNKMKWNETIASKCRYGDVAQNIWGIAEILWEKSEADYQGSASFVAKMPDGRYCFYEWSYGSCGGCDTWEAAHLSDSEIQQEMDESAAWFDDKEMFEKFIDKILGARIESYKPLRELNLRFDAILTMLENRSEGELKAFLEILKKEK